MLTSILMHATCIRRHPAHNYNHQGGGREPVRSGTLGLAHPEDSCSRSGGRRRSAASLVVAGALLALASGVPVAADSPDTAVLATELRGVAADVAEVKNTLRDLSQAMVLLVKMEQSQSHLDERVRGIAQVVKDQEERLQEVERDLPRLKELRKWVIAGVGAIGIAVVGAFMNGNLTVTVGAKNPPAVSSSVR
jgi:hypothetical protein